jgi:hypothetical protein
VEERRGDIIQLLVQYGKKGVSIKRFFGKM